jgi:hypothetical protein
MKKLDGNIALDPQIALSFSFGMCHIERVRGQVEPLRRRPR